jgi:hypothetical protein
LKAAQSIHDLSNLKPEEELRLTREQIPASALQQFERETIPSLNRQFGNLQKLEGFVIAWKGNHLTFVAMVRTTGNGLSYLGDQIGGP